MASGRYQFGSRTAVAACLLTLAGCAGPRLERALLADHNPAAHETHLVDRYTLQSPDVLTVRVRRDSSGPHDYRVDADGRIEWQGRSPLRVAGWTAPEVAAELARQLGVAPSDVEVRVASYESRQVFLHGEEGRLQRTLPWIGPETVVDFLQRIGGLDRGCVASEVQVVRTHIADGHPPEVLPVDLEAILFRHDQQTNIRLEPSDQVAIGQSSRSSFCRNLPHWLRPFFNDLFGLSGDPTPH